MRPRIMILKKTKLILKKMKVKMLTAQEKVISLSLVFQCIGDSG